MAAPSSTYRLQVRPGFDLHAAADVCDYLATLGAGAVYLSPILPSAKGSDHGYDVIGYDRIDPARGGMDGWTRLLAAARSRGLGVVVDIVPNHTGIAVPHDNAAWWSLLRDGRTSAYADWFDIDWTRGRVLVPVLGDDATPADLALVDEELHYGPLRFPVAPGTGPADGETAADVHARQHYELVNWRLADTELNYRRFFGVASLAGVRVEEPAVFDATHDQIGLWLREDDIDGLRVDHPDGLADPRAYLTRLRELAGAEAWITVEKILEPGESLPDDWPVDGTTGYDALAEVYGLFLDGRAESTLDETYRELTGDARSFGEHVRAGKHLVASTILQAEVARLARLAPGVARARDALAALLVAMPVYRSYLPTGSEHLAEALTAVRAARPELAEALTALTARLTDPADELCRRFQQTSGAVMAKGVEDTAYYRYTRFVGVNEVGGDPASIGVPPEEFHQAQVLRQLELADSMTALSTHDTKRGEDVRARLAVLTELPDEWRALVARLMAEAPLPDRAFAYLLWQTFAGAGFVEPARMHAYAEKAMREAASSTAWNEVNTAFESAVHAVIDRAYADPDVRAPLEAFVDRITSPGWTNSLAQKLVQLTIPGAPDLYQGTELWEDSLVDPDNRRPVDLDARRVLLDKLDAADDPPAIAADGAAKLWVVSRTLRLRRDWPELFTGYAPLFAEGETCDHAVAYDRGGVIAVATRLPVGLERRGGWGDAVLDVGGTSTDAISGRRFEREVALADLLGDYPVALLVR